MCRPRTIIHTEHVRTYIVYSARATRPFPLIHALNEYAHEQNKSSVAPGAR